MLGGARDWIRTSISLRTLRPEHSASTNFATQAFQLTNAESAICKLRIANIIQ